jgi:hypothetical protein
VRRYLNDESYYGGFDQKDLEQISGDMKSNFRSWVTGFAPRFVRSGSPEPISARVLSNV